jgi:hypothetical protein
MAIGRCRHDPDRRFSRGSTTCCEPRRSGTCSRLFASSRDTSRTARAARVQGWQPHDIGTEGWIIAPIRTVCQARSDRPIALRSSERRGSLSLAPYLPIGSCAGARDRESGCYARASRVSVTVVGRRRCGFTSGSLGHRSPDQGVPRDATKRFALPDCFGPRRVSGRKSARRTSIRGCGGFSVGRGWCRVRLRFGCARVVWRCKGLGRLV